MTYACASQGPGANRLVCFRTEYGSEFAASAFVDTPQERRVFRSGAIRRCDVALWACIPSTSSHLRLRVARSLPPAGKDINRAAVCGNKMLRCRG